MDLAACRGCGERVMVACERGREVVRDVEPLSVLPDGVHLCADPKQREQVELTTANLLFRCPECGAGYCSPSSWGRIVETPSSAWMSSSWDEPHQPHVCKKAAQAKPSVERHHTPAQQAGGPVKQLRRIEP